MNKNDTRVGAIVALIGFGFLLATMLNSKLIFNSTTSDGVPGAGFFPYILSIVLLVLGLALLIRGAMDKTSTDKETFSEETKRNIKILLSTFLAIILFLAFWQITKMFYLGTFLFCLATNKLFERYLKFNLIYSTVFTLFIYLIFSVGFSIQL